MNKLPNEVLLNIAEKVYHVNGRLEVYGHKSDLLSMRGTCRKLADIGRSLALKHVSFLQDKVGYDRLRAFSNSSCAGEVRYLTCRFQAFGNKRQDFLDWAKFYYYFGRRVDNGLTDVDLAAVDVAYAKLNHGRSYQHFVKATPWMSRI